MERSEEMGGESHGKIRSSQLKDPVLPVSLLTQELVDLIIQVTDTEFS